MTFKTFLNFTQIRTLPVALLSPIAGVLYAIYTFGTFHWLPTLLFFIGLAAINLFVSAWNNLMDYKKALDPAYKKWNIIAHEKIPLKLAWGICLSFLAIDLLIGIAVTCLTNLAILPVGGAALVVAVFYTFGPFAFSRFPLGEVLAGLCEGAIGFFLGIYVNSFDAEYFFIKFDGWHMIWEWDFAVLLPIVLVAIMCFGMNFNVMLSDNICDLAQDVRNERYTLVYFLKVPLSLTLYKLIYLLAGLVILAAIALHILSLWSLLMLLIAPLVIRNMRKFLSVQKKSETFILQIQNLVLFNSALAITILIGILTK
ncbi:MAG: UbiA family prenyltransferase [Streptococcaceae bacterium]|jgi:1,4-dihydroxy-2-naphthoate octaprenyltransferase|nr:UbiA family prenyltransferase [Streptococcaceae bacterium]